MKINDLNLIAQRLGAFGREHLGLNQQGHTVPTTSSLGGRIANWIRSRHSDTAAQANRDVMTGIINTIRQTDDLGDRFADIARKSLESKLAAGRPLSGRDAARVLQDVIRIKTSEDQARLETRLINVRDQFQKFCAPHTDGSPSDLETQTAARRQRFGLPPATAEQLQSYRDTVLRDLEARARRADHSLTAAESLDTLGESIRMKTLQEAKAGKVEYRLDKTNIIHCPIGKVSFGAEKLAENFNAIMGAIVKAKPAAAKGQYIKSCVVASTMGPGVKVNGAKLV